MMPILILGAVLLCIFGGTAFIGAPYVPSKSRELRRVFDKLCPLTPADTLVDIGSGDGVVLRAAAHHGARAIGYELNPILVGISRWLSRNQPLIDTRLVNFWRTQLPEETTVCYVFGDTRDIGRITSRIQARADQSSRSIRCISYGFELPGYEPIRTLGAHHLYEITPLQRG